MYRVACPVTTPILSQTSTFTSQDRAALGCCGVRDRWQVRTEEFMGLRRVGTIHKPRKVGNREATSHRRDTIWMTPAVSRKPHVSPIPGCLRFNIHRKLWKDNPFGCGGGGPAGCPPEREIKSINSSGATTINRRARPNKEFTTRPWILSTCFGTPDLLLIFGEGGPHPKNERAPAKY